MENLCNSEQLKQSGVEYKLRDGLIKACKFNIYVDLIAHMQVGSVSYKLLRVEFEELIK